MKFADILRNRLNAAGRQSMNILRIAAACKHGETITINGVVYEITTRADLAVTSGNKVIDLSAVGTRSSGTLTLTANAGNGETVTLGAVVYTFKTTLTGAANEILIGATATASLVNLIAAIMATTGAGSTYGAGTVVHPTISAAAGTHVAATGVLTLAENAADTNTVTIGGVVYTFQDTLTNVAGNVKIGASASATIDNLIAAIMGGAGSGSAYAAATVVHPTVTAAVGAGDTMGVTAKTAGAAGNLLGTTDTLAGSSAFGAATLTGGTSLMVATALASGTAGDALASTETMSAGSFGGSVLASGVDPTAAESSTGIEAGINDDDTAVMVATRISANEILLVSKTTNGYYACTETLSGSGNAFAAAATFGGAHVPTELPLSNIAKRSATATEVTLEKMHFIFGHDVASAIVQIRDSTGALKAWDGVVTYTGRRVSLASSGSTDIAATDEVSVLAA